MSNFAIADFVARDLMSAEVMTVEEGWTIQRLAEFFMANDITGAPVVNAEKKLSGVVSMSDIFKFENVSESVRSDALKRCYKDATGLDIASDADLLEWTKSAQTKCTVGQIMARKVISVDLEQTVAEVAHVLVENDIHRVFVIDGGSIVGVITSSDILRPLLDQVE